MRGPVPHSSASSQSSSFNAPVDEVPNFEAVFQVPSTHRLLVVRSRSRGGHVPGVYWGHEEYCSAGRLLARYESFEEISAIGERRCGWRKFDTAGRLLCTGDDLG